MSIRKKEKRISDSLDEADRLSKQIAKSRAGLAYMSEIDAEILSFNGQKADSVTSEILLHQLGTTNNIKIEEKDFNDFFAPLIKIQDWFGEDERKMTEKFLALKNLLQQNLRDLKVFRVGKIEIEIFVLGLDKDDILRGIQTKAVET